MASGDAAQSFEKLPSTKGLLKDGCGPYGGRETRIAGDDNDVDAAIVKSVDQIKSHPALEVDAHDRQLRSAHRHNALGIGRTCGDPCDHHPYVFQKAPHRVGDGPTILD